MLKRADTVLVNPVCLIHSISIVKNRYFLVLCLAWARLGHAQDAALACGNGRYVDDIFPAVTKTTDVVFGYNTAIDYYANTTAPVTLKLDFYEPAGDAAVQRPLLILAFGGSFVSGQRQDLDDLCQAFARKGYATATIDYRLVQPGAFGVNYALVYNRPDLLADEIVRAAADLKAAVRYFRHDAATDKVYRIDPTKVFVGGFSAGAITALQVAYTDNVTENSDAGIQAAYQKNGGLEGNTDFPAPASLLPAYNATGLAGVVNIAGGVNDLNIVSAGNPPLYSAQGTADEVVPYDCGPVYGSSYRLCGSHQLQAQATQVGLANQLHPVAGGNHSSPRNAANSSPIIAETATFLQALVCPTAPLPVVLTAFAGQVRATDCTALLTWRTATELLSRSYEVQAAADGQQFAPVGTVPSHNQPAGATYTFQTAPLTGTQYFRLRMLDNDGTATYSPVVTLAAACRAAPLVLAPNPARNHVQVSGLPAGRSQLYLYNALGQCVLRTTAEEAATLPTAGLLPGVYLLKVTDATGAAAGSIRLVKE